MGHPASFLSSRGAGGGDGVADGTVDGTVDAFEAGWVGLPERHRWGGGGALSV